MIEPLQTRFGEMFNDEKLRVVALIHPRFKLSWIPDHEREEAEELLKQEFLRENRKQSAEIACSKVSR